MQPTKSENAFPVRLGPGRHAGPGDGACLMELASMLAGEQWTDHPACVHPVLAGVARVVNDKVSDDERSRLAALVYTMIGTAPDDAASSARLVMLCADAALSQPGVRGHADICCELEAARRAARHLLTGRGQRVAPGLPLTRNGYTRRALRQASVALATFAGATPEERAGLCELLQSCVATCVASSSGRTRSPGREMALS
ncbi:MAG: hypothetical protein J2P27_00430 [Actinobacteria bacterium]|nr:hypothetical protein [Actinomycetota bacterium]